MSPSAAASNSQLAEFFRNHDHHTKLSKEEFEFVEALLFGHPTSSTNNSFLSLPKSTPSTSTMPRFNPISGSTSKLSVQASPFVLPSSTQKKLLFVAPIKQPTEKPIETKVLEEVKPKVVEAPVISQPVEKIVVPPVENRRMTATAKYLMQSLQSVDDNEEEKDTDMASVSNDVIMEKRQESPRKGQKSLSMQQNTPPMKQDALPMKQELPQKLPEFKFELPKTATAPLPEFKFDLPSSTKTETNPKIEVPQYKQFDFDLSGYSSSVKKHIPSTATLPEFRFEF